MLWPEAIETVHVEGLAATWSASPAWAAPFVTPIGRPSQKTVTVKDTERTGVWRVLLESLPPNRSTPIEIQTVSGAEAGFYGVKANELEQERKGDDILWSIDATYDEEGPDGAVTRTLVLGINYERAERIASIGTVKGQWRIRVKHSPRVLAEGAIDVQTMFFSVREPYPPKK